MKADPRLPELFERAFELPAAERAVWLAEVRRDDPDLAREIEELLRATPAAEKLLASPDWECLEPADLEPPVPRRIGPYRIERELGRGGMGRVFLAEQEGDDFRREVALKLLDRPVLADEDVRRFRDEVRLLATLEHPGIARFLDGGRAPDGTWFLALEYVEGVDLMAHVGSLDLSVAERVQLFLALLEPVAYAHTRSIVHRDLKPSNILIGRDGRPRLLDFGIAKLLDPPSGEPVTVTRTERRVFTPAYASPEQFRGGRVSAATDVYSLGVILYELLAGVSPYPGPSGSRAALESAVLTKDPAPPSAASRRRTRSHQATGDNEAVGPLRPPGPGRLGADLDAICLKALRKEPSARFTDARALAEDLRRYLAGLPVEARRGGRRYRVGRFLRRNRLRLASATAVVALGATLSATGVYVLHRPTLPAARTETAKIAVLPLKPVNAAQRDPALEFAMAESLILKLSGEKSLDVKRLYAVRKFIELDTDPVAAGRELGVDYVLASDYQIAVGHMRVTSHLLNVHTGEGDQTFSSDTAARDVFAMQDTVSAEIGNAVVIHFGRPATTSAHNRGTDNEQAYNLYNTALYLIDKETRDDAAQAADLLDRVVEIDPSYAQAWAVRAHAYCQFAHLGGGTPASVFALAEPMLEKALSLDTNNPWAYGIRGIINRDYHWNFAQAYRDLHRSIELDPGFVFAHRFLAGLYHRDGRFAEAIEAQKNALDLHPTSLVDHWFLGEYLIAAGRMDEGIAQLNRVVAMDRSFSPSYSSLWRIYQVTGDEARAFEYFIKRKQLIPDNEKAVASFKAVYDTAGWAGVLRSELEEVRSKDPRGEYSAAKVYIAQLAAQLGDNDLAFQYLEEALEFRLIGLSYLKVDPLLAPLRTDPRYNDLVLRSGL